ncbi:MAG: CCA tRNA nucleotidyltransferase [Cyanobacteria bacterium]|nr:CCA tRNA nucleotidyltransferase [Cyanobacteriota bacterium]
MTAPVTPDQLPPDPPLGRPAGPLALTPAAATELLWQRLRTDRWPVPRAALPADAALVGGAVRDGLLDRLAEQPDLDLVVSTDAIGLCQRLAKEHGGCAVVLDPQRDIARLVVRGWSLDLARRCGGSLAADLARRDYRINAIALPLGPGEPLVDPLGGLADLQARQLVAVDEANLLDDPLRLLRGIRLAAQLDFSLEAGTWAWIQRHHQRLASVAGERVLAELVKLAEAPRGHQGLQQALGAGLLQPWGADTQAAAALGRLSPEQAQTCGLNPHEQHQALPLARLARLFDAQALGGLRASRKLQQRCQRLRQWWQRLEPGAPGSGDPGAAIAALTEPERLALQRQLEDELPALLLAWPGPLAQLWLGRWRNPSDPLFHPKPPLDGRSLQTELGLAPSRRLGELLDQLTLERAFGRIGDREQALLWCRQALRQANTPGEKGPRRD